MVFVVFFALLGLLLALAEGVFLLATALRLASIKQEVLGEVLHADLAPRTIRWVGLALQGAALLLALTVAPLVRLLAVFLLPLIAGALWLAPRQQDQRCGSRGVQHGWEVQKLEDFEAWRLTGDHLRFRKSGRWFAVALPNSMHADMRARLEDACPERESKYRQ